MSFFKKKTSSGNEGASKKKIEMLPFAKISKKLRDKLTFHVGGSFSQDIISSHPQQEKLPLLAVNRATYSPFVSSFATTNIPASASFPSNSRQGTLTFLEDLLSVALEDPS